VTARRGAEERRCGGAEREDAQRESHSVELHPLDGYLLDGRPGKADAIAAALRTRSNDPKAQPFYRALESVGARAADEALLALRLVLAGKTPNDDAVRELRDARARARAGDPGGRTEYLRIVGAGVD
jgi:hypothetical protein